jgi:tetratricopeptide (TPR) repeat protein
MDDLNRAVELSDLALNATPLDHPNRAQYFTNLGNWRGTRFEQTKSMEDLDRAIEAADLAVDATPRDHLDRAGRLHNLGILLSKRFQQTESIDDIERSFSCSREGWECRNALPSLRIQIARRAASFLALQTRWEEASMLLEEAIELLPIVSPRSLQHTDKQHMLADFAGLASMAAATALNARKAAPHALRLLEIGRGVITSILLEMRSDISSLRQQHPKYADDFISLRNELDSPLDTTAFSTFTDNGPLSELRVSQRREAEERFEKLITMIRTQSGFQNFLLPPTADELMAAADPDPLITVNLSSYRCDAFLIERDQIRVLKLPGLTLKEAQERAQELQLGRHAGSPHMKPLLEWLWDVVARPCLEELRFTKPISDNKLPRVWWIPTGILTQLPLHAAGRHAQGSTETVLDRVMSSYSPSIKALIYGRRHHIDKRTGSLPNNALLIAMRETPGLSANQILPFAVDEVNMLSDLCPALQLKSIKPRLRKADVLQHLQACRLFHFAGHGRSDTMEPSQSCLLLEDWQTDPLTVEDLRDHRLQENAPFLAYLSACSTGVNEADRLVDEGIHLVGALQLAGFRHVVGTLWEVSDEHCVDVARILYETIRKEGMTDSAVCHGLHRAVKVLRNEQIEKRERNRNFSLAVPDAQSMDPANYYWVPYVHFGV